MDNSGEKPGQKPATDDAPPKGKPSGSERAEPDKVIHLPDLSGG